MSFWSDLLDIISSSAGNEAGITSGKSNVAPDITTSAPGAKFLTLTEGIWAAVTDGKLWRSLGWLLLGVVLILAGSGWWLKSSALPIPGAR